MIKFFIKYLLSSNKGSASFKKNYPKKSRYQNVEEADFKEIPDEKDKSAEDESDREKPKAG